MSASVRYLASRPATGASMTAMNPGLTNGLSRQFSDGRSAQAPTQTRGMGRSGRGRWILRARRLFPATSTVQRYFGTWNAALEAAGCRPTRRADNRTGRHARTGGIPDPREHLHARKRVSDMPGVQEGERASALPREEGTKTIAKNDPRHGTEYAYIYYECGCDPCRAAATAAVLSAADEEQPRDLAVGDGDPGPGVPDLLVLRVRAHGHRQACGE